MSGRLEGKYGDGRMTGLVLAALISTGQKFPGDIIFWHDQPIGAMAWNQKSGHLFYVIDGVLHSWPTKERIVLGDSQPAPDDSIEFSDDGKKMIVQIGIDIYYGDCSLENRFIKTDWVAAWWHGNELISAHFTQRGSAIRGYGRTRELVGQDIIDGDKDLAVTVTGKRETARANLLQIVGELKAIKALGSSKIKDYLEPPTSARFDATKRRFVFQMPGDTAYLTRYPLYFDLGSAGRHNLAPGDPAMYYGSGQFINGQFLISREDYRYTGLYHAGAYRAASEVVMTDPKTLSTRTLVSLGKDDLRKKRVLGQASYLVKNQWLAWVDNGPKNSGIYIRYMPLPK